MKSEYQIVKEEVSAAIQRERKSESVALLQVEQSRKRYEKAKADMVQALSIGDVEQYKKAGIAAEEARLELEFFEKRKASCESAQNATHENDRRIKTVINDEAYKIKIDTFDRLKTVLAEALNVCNEAQNRMNEIVELFDSWSRIVMKTPGQISSISETRLAVAQFASTIRGQLQSIGYINGGK